MRNNLKHTPRMVLFLALAFAVTSCSGWSGWLLSDTARNTFSEQQSCPEERIEMSYVVVQPQDVFQMPTPPAEVAADPGRLKVWTRKINDDFASYMDFTLFDVVGCGAHFDYFCWSEIQGDQAVFSCDPVALDNPHATFGFFRLKASAGKDLEQRLQARK